MSRPVSSELLTAAARILEGWASEPLATTGEAPTGEAPTESVAGHRSRVVAIGWATVELERSARELALALEVDHADWRPAARDPLLGASAWLGPDTGTEPRLVLLEPDTEGRLAASLARFGEGVAAVYVATADDPRRKLGRGRPGVARATSRLEIGPLGPARLLLGGPVWGPHVISLEAARAAPRRPDEGAPEQAGRPPDSVPSPGD